MVVCKKKHFHLVSIFKQIWSYFLHTFCIFCMSYIDHSKNHTLQTSFAPLNWKPLSIFFAMTLILCSVFAMRQLYFHRQDFEKFSQNRCQYNMYKVLILTVGIVLFEIRNQTMAPTLIVPALFPMIPHYSLYSLSRLSEISLLAPMIRCLLSWLSNDEGTNLR